MNKSIAWACMLPLAIWFQTTLIITLWYHYFPMNEGIYLGITFAFMWLFIIGMTKYESE